MTIVVVDYTRYAILGHKNFPYEDITPNSTIFLSMRGPNIHQTELFHIASFGPNLSSYTQGKISSGPNSFKDIFNKKISIRPAGIYFL